MEKLKTDKGLLRRLKKSAKTKMTAKEYEAQRQSYIRSCVDCEEIKRPDSVDEIKRTTESQEWGNWLD